MKIDAHPIKPTVTLSKTKGFGSGGETISETYDDLGFLWNCWVWRAAHSDDLGSEVSSGRVSDVGLLFQLPCTDSENGVMNLECFLKDDEKRKQEEKEAELLEQVKRAEISNA